VQQEFKDALAFAIVVAIVSFGVTLFYKWVSKYLEITKWS